MFRLIKLLGIISIVFLASCARNLEPIETSQIFSSAVEDIKKIEEIKNNNLNWEEDLEIDLYTAIALAIKNNKELKVKLLENALSKRQIDKVKFEMLPSLAANAGYSGSQFYKATTSATVPNTDMAGSIGEDFSTSSNRDLLNQDIGFTWNALDFGLSYIKAGQNADRYLISEENETKAAHNIVREVIRSYWNSMSADKMLKKYDPLLEDVNEALNDSKKIEELLLSKPMDALLYQKELLDIQRALQTQKQSFIDAKIQLGTLMGLLPNQKFKLIETKEPLNVLDMTLEEMEIYALQHRPELIEKHYEERISVEQAKAGVLSLLPGLNFNAAYTSTSNDFLAQKTNANFGATIGANLLNVFNYPTIKKINETNTEVIREQRLALSMTVLSQIHIANIDYKLALEEFETAQRYYEVSKKITEQVKNAQKIARFGQLEVIREQASLLVAELRYDIAFTKLQHSIGQIYSSTGIDVTEENIKKLGIKEYANLIENNFQKNEKKYLAKVVLPINKQNPIAKNIDGGNFNEFQFNNETFKLDGSGYINYSANLANNTPLPKWINFLPSQRKFIINKGFKGDIEEIELKVTAKNINTSINDTFTLLVDPDLRNEKLAKTKQIEEAKKLLEEKKLEEERLAKLKKEEEARRLEEERLAKLKEEEEAKRLEEERLAKLKEEEEAKRLEEEKLAKLKEEEENKKIIKPKSPKNNDVLALSEELNKVNNHLTKKSDIDPNQKNERKLKIEKLKQEKLIRLKQLAKLKEEEEAKRLEEERLAKLKLEEKNKLIIKQKSPKNNEVLTLSQELNAINEYFSKKSINENLKKRY